MNGTIPPNPAPGASPLLTLKASKDAHTGQTYVPPRELAADGSLRTALAIDVPASGVLYSYTTFAKENFGIVDLDCGSRIQVLLAPGTNRIGERVIAMQQTADGQPRFSHE